MTSYSTEQQQQQQQQQLQTLDHQQTFQWNMPYREGPKKEFVNIFDGLDNSKPLNFDSLKRQTFKDIFSCTNKNAVAIKKGLNYANFSKQDHDIISKQERNPVFHEYQTQICEYEPIKPPPFDLELNMKLARKRQKASLDRQCKKYIIKNIRTCTDFAKTQREKVRKSLMNRNGGAARSLLTESRLEKSYNNYLENSNNQTPVSNTLRKRRLQLIRRNIEAGDNSKTIVANSSTVLDMSRVNNHTISPIRNNLRDNRSAMQSLEKSQLNMAIVRASSTSLQRGAIHNNEGSNNKPPNLLFLNRKLKSQNGTRRFNENEFLDVQPDNQRSRFKQRNQQRTNLFTNPEPVTVQVNQNRNNGKEFNTIQQNHHKPEPLRESYLNQAFGPQKKHELPNDQLSQADQIQRRSLSSHCRRRPIPRHQKHPSFDEQTSVKNMQSIAEKASQAYKENDPNAERRIQNLEKFILSKKKIKKGNLNTIRGGVGIDENEVAEHAMNYLDKLAALNGEGDTKGDGSMLILNNYQWNTNKNVPKQLEKQNSKLFELGLTDDPNNNNNIKNELETHLFNLAEEESLIDSVLFDRQKISLVSNSLQSKAFAIQDLKQQVVQQSEPPQVKSTNNHQERGVEVINGALQQRRRRQTSYKNDHLNQKLNQAEQELHEERSKRKISGVSSQISGILNKAKGGGYSKLNQAKSEAQQREKLEKMEIMKNKERQIIKEKKLREQEKERRIAEERLKKISEEQNMLKQKKDQQKEFYTKFLRQTAEQNLKKIEEKRVQNIQQIINDPNPSHAFMMQQQQQQNVLSQQNSQKQMNQNGFQSRIPVPKFARDQQNQRQAFNSDRFNEILASKPLNKDQEKKFVNNLNGLDLELSQTKRQFAFQQPQLSTSPAPKKLLDRGDLIESLDLNIGYESIQKLKDNWGFLKPKQVHNETRQNQLDGKVNKNSDQPKTNEHGEPDFERDSLEASSSSDEEKLKDDEMKLLQNNGRQKYSYLSKMQKQNQNDVLGQMMNTNKVQPVTNKEWIENSIRQSVYEWKEMLKFSKDKENHDQNQIINQPKPMTWIDQEYQKNNQKNEVKSQQQTIDSQIEAPMQQPKEEKDEFTFGEKLQKLDTQNQQQNPQVKPPKPHGGKSVTRGSKFDDSKSAVSKVSRVSSKSSRQQRTILSKEEELKQAKEKKEKLDQIKKQYSIVSKPSSRSKSRRDSSKNRNKSPGDATTKCTREEDINIEEFMKDDLRAINKEEDKLQRELLNIHKQNLHKHHQVVSKHHIDTNINNTEQLIRKMVNAPTEESNQSKNSKQQQAKKLMRPGVNEQLEDQIEESLENLDNLLNNIKSGDHAKKEQEILKIGKKYNIEFNLDGGGEVVNGYSKHNQQQKQAFEYQQPFSVQSQQPQINAYSQQSVKPQLQMINQPISVQPEKQTPKDAQNHQQVLKQPTPIQKQSSQSHLKQPKTQQVSQNQQQQPSKLLEQIPQQQLNQQQPQQQQQQQQQFQFQPFQNMDVISNLYSQQQKMQQMLQQQMQFQQMNLQQIGGTFGQQMNGQNAIPLYQQPGNQAFNNPTSVSDPYAYNINNQVSFKGSSLQLQQQNQQFMEQQVVRCNKDMIKMRRQQNANQAQSSNQQEDDSYEDDSIDFNQYAQNTNNTKGQKLYQNLKDAPIEDSLEDNRNNAINNNRQKQGGNTTSVIKQSNGNNQTGAGDVVKVNPKFNMKILFDDD